MNKKRRKYKIKMKRIIKQKKGIKVPFSLSNCPKKLSGINNRYEYKCNVHHCVFKDTFFEHVRYRAGHITNSNFRNTKFSNVDFIAINLKNNKFEYAEFKKCLFYGCNFSGSCFEGALFEDCIFINCKLVSCKHLTETNIVIDKENDLELPIILVDTVLSLDRIERFNILKTKDGKVNKILIKLLLELYPVEKLIRGLRVISNWKSKFITFYDYKKALQVYLKE